MSKQAAADPRVGPARLWIVVGVVGLVWAALHGLGVLDRAGTFTVIVAAGTAVVATVVGLRRSRPKPMWPWLAILGALGLFLLANVLRIVFETLGNLGPTRSLLPDLFALPPAPLLPGHYAPPDGSRPVTIDRRSPGARHGGRARHRRRAGRAAPRTRGSRRPGGHRGDRDGPGGLPLR